LKFLKIDYNNVENKTPERRIRMSIPKEKWDKMFTILQEFNFSPVVKTGDFL
jgi:hypothetical protein